MIARESCSWQVRNIPGMQGGSFRQLLVRVSSRAPPQGACAGKQQPAVLPGWSGPPQCAAPRQGQPARTHYYEQLTTADPLSHFCCASATKAIVAALPLQLAPAAFRAAGCRTTLPRCRYRLRNAPPARPFGNSPAPQRPWYLMQLAIQLGMSAGRHGTSPQHVPAEVIHHCLPDSRMSGCRTSRPCWWLMCACAVPSSPRMACQRATIL